MNYRSKMSNRKFRRILIPILALTLSLSITINVGVSLHPSSLDTLFGKGQKTITSLGRIPRSLANYYPQLYTNTGESRAAAIQVSKRISDEGIVLLKNNGVLPLPPDTKISPLGLRYVAPFYGGTGSAAIGTSEDYLVTPQQGISMVFHNINTFLEERLWGALSANQDLAANPNIVSVDPLHRTDRVSSTLFEFDSSVYRGTEFSCKGTVGVVFLGRQTGENLDAATGVYTDKTPHMLAPTAAELETLAFAKAYCRRVVVVLVSSAPMQITQLEDDEKISAIVWTGGTGSSGYQSLGEILAGKVVPSGRLPDLYPADFKKAPTFPNHDDGTDAFVYRNAQTTLVGNYSWEENANTPFHEYEEGVYLGYKYYETAYDIGYLTDYYNRKDGVLYPFGYGLSYTDFSQQIISFFDHGSKISMTVRVKNIGGTYSGKDVVQLYFTSPYTDFDRQYSIEKPTAVLVGFAKTGLLAPGEYEDVHLSFLKEDMASYCYTRSNGDGTVGCYVLESGEYTLSIRANSHQILASKTTQVPATIWYDNSNPRHAEVAAQSQLDENGHSLGYPASRAVGQDTYRAATNQFEQINTYMTSPAVSSATLLSRKDWAGTQPSAPSVTDRTASKRVISWVAASDSTKYDFSADGKLGNQPGSLVYSGQAPTAKADNGIVLADLRGRSYYDPMWDMLLDQLTLSDAERIRQCLFESAYGTGRLDAVGKPESVERDGPQGLTQPDQLGRNWLSGACGYPSAPVMAATWNQPLMYDFGYMVGQEALVLGINGWYAPALNTHRSPFGGRTAEYFSEDGVLGGYLGAQILSGGGDAGVYCSVKHFVLMEAEGHRNPHTANWLTEQALREIYLKPFELALNTAMKTIWYISDEEGALRSRTMRAGDFIMTADCAVGADWSSTNYELLTCVVRGEWGFQGTIISDMGLNSNDSRVDKMLRSGCDLLMSTSYGKKAHVQDYSSPTGQTLLRRAIKNICYTTVNSNLTQGATPGSVIQSSMAPWQVCLLVINTILALLITAAIIWMIARARDEKRHPHHYME